jgi:hypothetical protein
MKTPEEQFEHELELFRRETNTITGLLYANLSVNELAVQDNDIILCGFKFAT